jgi:hypothetical protein
LTEADLSYDSAEIGYPTPSGHITQLNGDPTYTAGGGPSGENSWSIPVIDSSGLVIGDFIKNYDEPFPSGNIYEIIDVPNGTEVVVHAGPDDMDISDGDTVEETTGLGEYAIKFQFQADTYLDPNNPDGYLEVVMITTSEANNPAFTVSSSFCLLELIRLDLTGQNFRIG